MTYDEENYSTFTIGIFGLKLKINLHYTFIWILSR